MFRFSHDDLEIFGAASHDRNPLHLSVSYARRTPFGEPVVFGVLGVLRALAAIPDRDLTNLESVTVNFRNPMYVSQEYSLEIASGRGGQVKVSVVDAGRPLLSATFGYRTGGNGSEIGETAGIASLREAARWTADELVPGLTVSGDYAPNPGPFRELLTRLGLRPLGNAASVVSALLWSSYLVGMELPGERAVFSRLKIRFDKPETTPEGPIAYQARVESFDERFDILETTAALSQSGRDFAQFEISSFVRADSPRLRLDHLSADLPPSEALRGQRALVVGGSRGLGASIVAALASQGCEVILNYHSSQEAAEGLVRSFPEGWGKVVLAQGDAADPAWGTRWRTGLGTDGRGLDFLVCNAIPPARALPFGLETLDRARRFLTTSFDQTTVPLAAFRDLLGARGGIAVIISSVYASPACGDLHPDLSHYVAAKQAVEGLARSLSCSSGAEHYLIVRPPRLLTDQTNMVTARQGAMAVEGVAAAIVRRLSSSSDKEKLSILEGFGP